MAGSTMKVKRYTVQYFFPLFCRSNTVTTRVLPKFQKTFSYNEWNRWKKMFQNLMVAEDIKGTKRKLAMLITHGGEDMAVLVDNVADRNEPGVGFSVSLVENNEYTKTLVKLDDFFAEKAPSFAVVERFRALKQGTSEDVKSFSLKLKEAVKACNYQDEDRMLLEQFLRGIRDIKIKNRLLIRQHASFEEALVQAETEEAANKTTEDIKSETEINYVAASDALCYFCKRTGHVAPSCTKLKEHVCGKCHKKGHSGKYCRARTVGRPPKANPYSRPKTRSNFRPQSRPPFNRVSRVDFVEEDTNQNDEEVELVTENQEYIFSLESTKFVQAIVGGVRQEFVLDTGAKSNIVPRPHWLLMKEKGVKTKNQTKDVKTVFKAFGASEPLAVIGLFSATLQIGDKTGVESFYVLEKGDKCLLGADTIFGWNLFSEKPNVG